MKLLITNLSGETRDFFEGTDLECYETVLDNNGIYIDENNNKWYIEFEGGLKC